MAKFEISLEELSLILNENINTDIFSDFITEENHINFKIKTNLSVPKQLKLSLELDSFDAGQAKFLITGTGVKMLSRLKSIQILVQDSLQDFDFISLDLPFISIDLNRLIANYINGICVDRFIIRLGKVSISTHSFT